ncbi:MAG: DUF262 domain-containing protein [Ignavibacteriales bacterium]|nr:DUF262 domain-containing protein [Ignavibacteriales bacterium]
MKASETKFQPLIEGTKQYVIPLFQRPYSWDKSEWNVLWNDIIELFEYPSKTHFFGSIVTSPTTSVPEGVTKYLLIDGQQRITTIFVILVLLRNKAVEEGKKELSEEIEKTLLINQFKKDLDYYKLLPTQSDRKPYQELIHDHILTSESQIAKAYQHFEKLYNKSKVKIENLKTIISNQLIVVSILLESDDNPYLVFESLNAKGRPLTQADLIRNYFIMLIHVNEQDAMYNLYWLPMQTKLGDSLPEFIRHYLMQDGDFVKQNEVYFYLKNKVNRECAIDYLKRLAKFADYYNKLLNNSEEVNKPIASLLERLNRIEATTTYPFLMKIYDLWNAGKFSSNDVFEILKLIENFMIRRFVCNVPTNQLNKIFPSLFNQITAKYPDEFISGLKFLLQERGYPNDLEFRYRIKESKFYGAGGRAIKTKLILESIEEFYNHKEIINFQNLTVEHIMPQTLSEKWQEYLGVDWEQVHEFNLNSIGNLTLTAYNSEISNALFGEKKKHYANSHLELNKYFNNIFEWREANITIRSMHLAEIMLRIWPFFGEEKEMSSQQTGVTGKTPRSLSILGQFFEVNSWRDVLSNTLNTIADLEPEKFEIIIKNYPRFVSLDGNKFRATRKLINGAFVEVNLSAQSIQRFCFQALETIDLSSEDWRVETS